MDMNDGRELHQGGSVEPDTRSHKSARGGSSPTREGAGRTERYELRDPFAEVTYRFQRPSDAIAKAESAGATRFHAVDEDGKRVAVNKVNGEWQRADGEALLASVKAAKDERERADRNVIPIVVDTPAAPPLSQRQAAAADKAARIEFLEASLRERYVVKRSSLAMTPMSGSAVEYRFRGDTSRVAFTETSQRLSTSTNNPSVARSMVDVAEARGWRNLRVSGNDDFRRMVWLEASVRGVRTVGYEPQHEDLQMLKKEREAREINRIEPAADRSAAQDAAPPRSKRSASGKAVLATLKAVLVDKGVPARQQEAVLAAAAEHLSRRERAGETVKVKVFDMAAPSKKQPTIPAPTVQRDLERHAPSR